MGSADRGEAIRRLERERAKIDGEIENILANYAKESGNHALRPKKRRAGAQVGDWDFDA